MDINKIKEELKEMRKLNRRGIDNDLSNKYRELFTKLPPLESRVMNECYIYGKSYLACGRKVDYCERQVRRIVEKSIDIMADEERVK